MSGLVIQLLMDNLYQYMFNNWSTHTSKPCLAFLAGHSKYRIECKGMALKASQL